jgi:hypothetical protein
VLSDYTSLLLRLATSDAPTQAATQVAAVELSLNNLTDRVGKLCGDPACAASNTKFKTSVSNVSAVIQPILKGFSPGR